MHQRLQELLAKAYAPCEGFTGSCSGHCAWDPARGLVPCGFGGATGSLNEVRLVVVTAEPADPPDDAQYSGDPIEMVGRSDRILQDALTFSLNRAGRPTPFHKRLRRILDMFFPSTNLEAQLKATWFTNTVLCPAEFSGGFHDGSVERACLQRFFSPQLSLFGHAFVLVLGDKAERRMQEAGFRFEASAPHPSARKSLEDLEAAWRRAADLFRRRQKEGPQDQGSSSERVSQTESIKSDSPEHDAILQEILAELSKEHRDLFDEIACNPAFELTPMRMQLALRYNGRKVGGLNRRIERYYISKTFAPRELFAELMEEAGFEWKIKNEVHQYWEAPKAIGPSAMRMVIDKMCRHTVRR